MIPADHPLSSVRNEFNSVMFDGDMTGAVVLNGPGAGSLPTASAVVSDIVQLASRMNTRGNLSAKQNLLLPKNVYHVTT
jgi:homoserine dehydrogenase